MKPTLDIRRSRWTLLKSGWFWFAVVLAAGITAVTSAVPAEVLVQ